MKELTMIGLYNPFTTNLYLIVDAQEEYTFFAMRYGLVEFDDVIDNYHFEIGEDRKKVFLKDLEKYGIYAETK